MTIQLSDELSKELSQPITGDGIQLPFFAPIIWWKNGDKKLLPVGGVQYFGGWAMNESEYDIACSEFLEAPANFQAATYSGRDGTFNVFESRIVSVAPVIIRKRWHDNRSHIQALCYMATSKTVDNKRSYVPWGPVVLSMKGLQTQRFQKALKEWEAHTADGRREHAPGVPAYAFYCILGTFSDTINVEMVGKGTQSPITPIELWKPAIEKKNLTTFFIGEEVAAAMADLKAQAQDWANDDRWTGGEVSTEDDAPPFEPHNLDDPRGDFPF